MLTSRLLILTAALLGYAEAASSAGCGTSHSFIGSTQTFSITSSGGTRTYRIHLPSSYEASTAVPLIIAYHGSGGNPTDFEITTRFSDEGLNPNMVVVYPAGVDGNWQGPTYATAGVSDKVFTTDLVNHIKDNYCIDSSRVYAAGHSNGGGFVGTLACSPDHGGNQFAAFAAASGAFYTDVVGDDACHPARSPLPILEIHGGADTTIPYAGGEGRGGPLPSIPDWLSRWATRNQCGTSTVSDLANGVHHSVWTCAGQGAVLQHWKIDGHDHSYPGQGAEVDASARIVEFFSSQALP
ncbi:family 1 carbohydrate esterase [Xylariaceae sp. FL1019]|nr:family 1 carbohydrate esterase [Xylariaceae sp. FL1019]